jgi:mRNA-degrading endonuclease RelE of RelBE toxin-antitoxin system
MKLAEIVYSPTARKYLRHLHPSVKQALREAIEELGVEPLKGKPLQEEFEGFRSHRFKRYRVIYRYVEKEHRVEVLLAGPRQEVYRLFGDYLKELSG